MENTTAGEAPVLDAKDAPDGYVAVPGILCHGCAFIGTACWNMDELRGFSCTETIFVPRHVTSVPANLLHPMGSMGEEVAL